jgi:hypothetical protein
MFDRLPSRTELAVFALMAVACAAAVSLFPKHDYAMMFAAMPLFLVSAVMGLRRSERFKLPRAAESEAKEQLPD